MSNTLSPEMLAQIFAQTSEDPFLTLVTFSHADLPADILLVNNTVDVVSRGNTFSAFPMKVKFPVDDGERSRNFTIEFDNVSLELVSAIRTVTSRIDIKIEMILASIPDIVQVSQDDLQISSLTYNQQKIVATVVMDGFLNTELTSERYLPTNFPGLFG